MLLTALKFVAYLWLAVLVAGLIVLAVLYLFELLARAIRQRGGRQR